MKSQDCLQLATNHLRQRKFLTWQCNRPKKKSLKNTFQIKILPVSSGCEEELKHFVCCVSSTSATNYLTIKKTHYVVSANFIILTGKRNTFLNIRRSSNTDTITITSLGQVLSKTYKSNPLQQNLSYSQVLFQDRSKEMLHWGP